MAWGRSGCRRPHGEPGERDQGRPRCLGFPFVASRPRRIRVVQRNENVMGIETQTRVGSPLATAGEKRMIRDTSSAARSNSQWPLDSATRRRRMRPSSSMKSMSTTRPSIRWSRSRGGQRREISRPTSSRLRSSGRRVGRSEGGRGGRASRGGGKGKLSPISCTLTESEKVMVARPVRSSGAVGSAGSNVSARAAARAAWDADGKQEGRGSCTHSTWPSG